MKEKNKVQYFHEVCARNIIRFRWLVLLLVAVVTTLFFSQFSKLSFNSSFEAWFFDDDPAMVRLEDFEKFFGNDAFVYIVVEKEKFSVPFIRTTKKLVSELEKTVPYLKTITWLGNAETVKGEDNTIRIERLFKYIPENQSVLEERLKKGLMEDEFRGRYISDDGKALGILLDFEVFPDNEGKNSIEITEAINGLLQNTEFHVLNAKVVGNPIFEAEYSKLANKETPKLFLICIGIQALIFFCFFRSFRGVIVPLVVVTLSFLWTLGTIALLGFELDLMIIGLPVLLICIGIGDSMHLLASFFILSSQGLSRNDALVRSFGKVGVACFLTSLTTAIGFLAFGVAPIEPFLRMGIYLPLGIMYTYLLTMLLVPVFFSFGKKLSPKVMSNPLIPVVNILMDKLSDLLIKYPFRLLTVFVVSLVISLIGTMKLEVESNTTHYLSTKVPLRRNMDSIDERMAGSFSLEIMLDTGVEGGIKNPLFLNKLDTLQQKIEKEPLVRKALSVATILKKVRRAMHNDEPLYYAIPENSRSVGDYFAMYELSGGENLNKFASLDFSRARLMLQTKSLSSKDTRYLENLVLAEAKNVFKGDSVAVFSTGLIDVATTLNDNMGKAQRLSIFFAFVLVGFTMIVAFRSFKFGALTLIPNLLPIFATLGFMGFFNIYMDTVIMTVCGMVIGVSIDDTTHLFVCYKRSFAACGNYKKALRLTLHDVGYPVLFTTFTLCLGFLTLLPSVMNGWVRIGFLAPFAFFWALIGTLFFAGPIILLTKPLGPESCPDE